MSNIQKQHKISPAIAWLTIQKFIIFYCPLDGEHTKNKKQVLFFRQIPLDLIMYQMMMDSPQIKNATSAIPGTSNRLSALCMASIMEDKSSP